MFQTKVGHKMITHSLGSIFFFRKYFFHGITWKNMADPDEPLMRTWCCAPKMRFACRLTRARIQTHTIFYPYYFPRQQSFKNTPQGHTIVHYLSCTFSQAILH